MDTLKVVAVAGTKSEAVSQVSGMKVVLYWIL